MSLTPEHRRIIEHVRASTQVIRRAVEGVPRERFDVAPKPGEWSALETLTHLRDVIVHVYGLRIRRLLYEHGPVFADFDEESYRPASLARGESVEYLLATVIGEHEQLARLLEAVPDADWAREGRHPQFGSMSLEFLARRIGEHAEEHAAQITAAGRA
jgi:DinB superfamily